MTERPWPQVNPDVLDALVDLEALVAERNDLARKPAKIRRYCEMFDEGNDYDVVSIPAVLALIEEPADG